VFATFFSMDLDFTDIKIVSLEDDLKWRNVIVDRKFLVVECVPEEIETHHLRDLKQDIYFANGEYRKYLQHQYHGEHKSSQTQSLERDRIRDMKDRLKFD
jgi:hypothetical protein